MGSGYCVGSGGGGQGLSNGSLSESRQSRESASALPWKTKGRPPGNRDNLEKGSLNPQMKITKGTRALPSETLGLVLWLWLLSNALTKQCVNRQRMN